jgi:hypothetical protein
MPMDFPDYQSLKSAAKVHKFRKPLKGESEDDFREALADHVEGIDYIESCEIRNKVGWDKFSPNQNVDMVMRSLLKANKEGAS